jgi:hypothetical protein
LGKLEPDSSPLTGVERMALADAVSSEATMIMPGPGSIVRPCVVVDSRLEAEAKSNSGLRPLVGKAAAV